jgi:nitroreductase
MDASDQGLDLATVDRLLTTTRAVRGRLDLSRPVPLEVVEECLRLALQAPNSGNVQEWRWLIVTDPEIRRSLAQISHQAQRDYMARLTAAGGSPRVVMTPAAMERARFVAEHFHQVPVFVFVGAPGPVLTEAAVDGQLVVSQSTLQASLYGTVFPAVWSFQLALRSRGLGTALTTLIFDQEAALKETLGIPDEVVPVAFLPIAYYTGTTFRPAARRPLEEVTFWDRWGQSRSPEVKPSRP